MRRFRRSHAAQTLRIGALVLTCRAAMRSGLPQLNLVATSCRPFCVGAKHCHCCRKAFPTLTPQLAEERRSTVRDIVLGRSSKVWQAVSREPGIAQRFTHAIGHRDLETFQFTDADRVWVLSYSRNPVDNEAIIARLRRAGVAEVVYVSSSSTIVGQRTRCYEYPRVKLLAETEALRWPQARVLTIGLMYRHAAELPAGENIATSYSELAQFMLAPRWSDDGSRRTPLLRRVRVSFRHAIEARLFLAYGALIDASGAHPCLLRPLDLALRVLGMRWYGYTYLSNRLWISTMS